MLRLGDEQRDDRGDESCGDGHDVTSLRGTESGDLTWRLGAALCLNREDLYLTSEAVMSPYWHTRRGVNTSLVKCANLVA